MQTVWEYKALQALLSHPHCLRARPRRLGQYYSSAIALVAAEVRRLRVPIAILLNSLSN